MNPFKLQNTKSFNDMMPTLEPDLLLPNSRKIPFEGGLSALPAAAGGAGTSPLGMPRDVVTKDGPNPELSLNKDPAPAACLITQVLILRSCLNL